MKTSLVFAATIVLIATSASAQEFAADVEMMSFDDRGGMLPASAQRLDALLEEADPPTDVFVVVHGWNNSFSEAQSSYRNLMRLLEDVAREQTLLSHDYRSLVLGVSWPSKAWDEEVESDADDAQSVSDDDLLTLYRAFPPSKGGDAYEQDIQTMQRLLAAAPQSLSEADYRTATLLFEKYRLPLDEGDAEDRDFPVLDADADGWFGEGFSIRDALRLFTYWQMKQRAGIVGRDGVRPKIIDRVQQALPTCRIHLIGHSFGCKATLAAISAEAEPTRKIDSVILLQGAVSYQAMSSAGGYANVVGRVAGPVVATYSEHDSALGLPYELASRVAGQTAELDVSIYSALGRIGAETGSRFRIVGSPANPQYPLGAGLFSANGQDFILGHSDYFRPAVARLIWAATLPPRGDAESEEITCDCADHADADLVDEEEAALPPISERELRSPNRLAPTDADTTNLRAFFGTLHGHTKYSDGSGLPSEAFEHARDKAGVDYFALTEHNHTSNMPNTQFVIGRNPERYEGPGSDALIPVANAMTTSDFVALYGQEVSSISKGNHLCVFDVPNVVDDTEVPNGDFDALLNAWLPTHLDTTGQQAVVQLNHPWSGSPNSVEYGRDDFSDFTSWLKTLGKVACLIEVANGPSHDDAEGVDPATINLSEFRRYLKMGFRLAPSANQDNHKRTWGTITAARTAILAETLSKESLLAALRARRAYATLDSNLRLFVSVQGQPMGGTASGVSTGEELSVEVTIQDDDESNETYWVEVFADKIVGENATSSVNLVATYGPLTVSDNTDQSTTFELPDLAYDDWDYLYLKVSQGPESQPKQQAFLAPVWFE